MRLYTDTQKNTADRLFVLWTDEGDKSAEIPNNSMTVDCLHGTWMSRNGCQFLAAFNANCNAGGVVYITEFYRNG